MQPILSTPPNLTPKQIPFKQIKPIKYMGINSSLPFNSLISDSKLIYFSGRSIILENIKTYEQKPIWTNEFNEQPMVIEHILNIHRQNMVGIAIRDDSQNHLIIIMNINSQINNYEHLNKKEREKDRLHYLKNITGDQTIIEKLKFLYEGAMFTVVVAGIEQKINQAKQILVLSSMSGDLLYRCEFNSLSPLIESLQLNRQSYICIIKNEPEQNIFDSLLHSKNSFQSSKRPPSSNKANSSFFFKITLIDSADLFSKNEFLIDLNSGQTIVELRFFENHKRTFAFLLLSSGFLLIYMVNDRGFHDVCRVDVRIDKIKHEEMMKQRKAKTDDQIDELKKEPDRSREVNEENTREQMIHQTRKLITSDSDLHNPSSASSSDLKLSFSEQRQTIFFTSPQNPEYFYPTCISCSNSKVAIGYEGCAFIGLVTYSAVDHREYKFRYIFDFFVEKPEIQAIRKLSFSEDGCHCSVLVKVDPYKTEMFRRKGRKVESSDGEKGLIGDASSQFVRSIKKLNTMGLVQKKSIESIVPKRELQKKSKQQKRAKILLRSQSTTAKNLEVQQALFSNCQQQQPSQQRQHFTLMHVDFISGMVEHEYHSESIEQSITTTSLKGTVELAEFNKMNNTMLVLMSDNRLYYYYVNPTYLHGEKESATSSAASTLRKKYQQNSLFAFQSVNNYLPPQSIQLWVEKLKLKPFIILCHPFMFELVLIFQDNLKFHFYNYGKMFECHHVLNLKNCKAASYSPYGDKLALGTVGSIWLVDSYTHSVIKKISLVIFPSEIKSFSKPNKLSQEKPSNISGRRSQSMFMSLSSKTVSRIQYINNDDLIIQTGNTTVSMLLNYQKVLFYGATSEAIQGELFHYDFKHRLGIIASETSVKVISKCSINSKNKCEELARIDLAVTAVRLCGEIDILFLGGANGVLYFIRWPEFFQNDSLKTPNISNKLHLFHCPIVDIQISINYRQLYVMSKDGMMVICELIHSDEVQKIGKDVSFRMAKKIDLPLPLMNKWLLSTSDEQKRAQSITKLMGNEAEFKNNESLESEEYQGKLQKLLQLKKQELDQQLKIQIRQYEEESGISKLQMQVAFLRDEIKRVVGKREIEAKQVNQGIDKDLHKVFVERERLQKELKQLTEKTSADKRDFCQNLDQSLTEYRETTNRHFTTDQKTLLEQERMFENKMKIDRALQQNMIEDFMDQRYDVQKQYAQGLQQIYHKNNELTSQNRNKKVQMTLITQKMRQLSARMFELQHDNTELMKEHEQVTASKKTLSQQIYETDKKYHALIKKTKEIQITLNKTRASSEVCQLKFDDLEKEMKELHERWKYLEEKREESETDFVEQFKLRNFNFSQTAELKVKLKELKAKRKHAFETNVLLKSLIKPYEKQLTEINQNSSGSLDSSLLEHKKYKTNKLTSDVGKWNNIKNENKRKVVRYTEKLQEENNKLLFRFNQLQKECKELQNIENNLREKITLQKQKEISHLTAKWERVSFVQKEEKQTADTKEKISFISIHKTSDNKDQLNATWYQFPAAKSLHRDNISVNSTDDLKKAGSLLKTFFRKSEYDPKISKKGSSNLQFLLDEKRKMFKERKENAQSLYHGVTLDKETLKPKKTMCLSLHQDGEDKGKFVTQY